MHIWGDKDFDWSGLNKAIMMIVKDLKRWRIGVRQYKEKWGCYDKETRVLTKDGWKYFKDLDINKDQFACLNNDNYLEYHKTTDYIKYLHNGDMYKIKTIGVDLLVTPHHNLYVAKADVNGGRNNNGHKKFEYKLQSYHSLFRKDKNFFKGAKWNGNEKEYFILPEYKNEWNNIPNKTNKIARKFFRKKRKIPMYWWLQFLGWFIAEGSYSHKCSSGFSIHIKELDEITNIVEKCGYKYRIIPSSNSDKCVSVIIDDKQTTLWLIKHCGQRAENKKVPDFIKELSPKLIEIFLKSLYLGDGHQSKTALTLYTVSNRLSDDVLELLLKAGYCGKASKRFRPNYFSKINDRIIKHNYPEISIRWLKKIVHRSSNCHDSVKIKEDKEQIINYNDNVYCVTVPYNKLYIERNGTPVWCGNSARVYCSLGWYSLLSITHPGYSFYPYPKWLRWLDIYVIPKIIKYVNKIVYPIHKRVYRNAYKKACDAYPHLMDEICCMADFDELLDFYNGGKNDYK